jgi:hypothetical protein
MNLLEKIKAPFTKVFVERMTQKAIDQDEFGYVKYKQYLDPMDDYDWLNMGTEEYVDLGKYMEAERYKRDKILGSMYFELDKLQDEIKEGTVSNEYVINTMQLFKKDIRRLTKNLDGLEQGKASK